MKVDDPRYGRWIALVANEIITHGTWKKEAEYNAHCQMASERFPVGCFARIKDPNEDAQYDAFHEDRGR